MARFTAETEPLNAPQARVFEFLSDFRNMEHLMPEQIVNWKADEVNCSFTIKSMADLAMRITSKKPPSNIHIESTGSNPIDYTLDYSVYQVNDHQCFVEIDFQADLNPFLSMVASRPLQHLVDHMALKLKEKFGKEL
ncbi:MAG TPA: SRPBCC family protein [Bacteroidales bacterium]|nr:SRPBCC family protein [Bacteroidales bacterium]